MMYKAGKLADQNGVPRLLVALPLFCAALLAASVVGAALRAAGLDFDTTIWAVMTATLVAARSTDTLADLARRETARRERYARADARRAAAG